MKKCKGQCSTIKPLTEFYADQRMPDKKANICKICKNKKTKEWRKLNADKYNAYMRDRNKFHYEKLRLNRYDITPEQYKSILGSQNNMCAIPGCGKKGTGKRKLAIDHDHKTGKVRGVLCYKHNRDMNAIDNELALLLEYKKKHE